MSETAKEKVGLFTRFISGVEKVGNKLPHPFYLFCILIVVAVVLSVIFSGVTVSYERASSSGGASEIVSISVRSILSRDIITNLTQNLHSIYFSFSPLSMMALLMLSIGLAEQVGLFESFIKRTIMGAPPSLVFAVVSFIAINANTASNAGILGCTIVAASVFKSLGYNPWLGILLGYAAGNAGMSANVFVGNLDVLMSGINESVVQQLGIDAPVHVLQHWFFMAASAIVLTVGFTLLTTKFMYGYIGEPGNLGAAEGGDKSASAKLTPEQSKALGRAGIAAIVYFLVIIAICLPSNSFFRAADGSIVPTSPLLQSVLTLLFGFFMTTGIAYGRSIGKIPTWNTLPRLLMKSLESVLNFMVIALPASVFIHLFNASNIPTVMGVKGAELIQQANLSGLTVLIMIALLSAFLNLFMTSGSAKWMILAPIFIPMFFAIGFSPGLTSLAYRIGDSATNAIAPISTDIALIVALLEQYRTREDQKAGMGTVFAGCMPYAIMTLILELILLVIWYVFNLPLGPGVSMFM